jgi:hypothetical protein
MTILTPVGPGSPARRLDQLEAHEKSRLRAAARHARQVYPGDIGELIFRELTAYADFGIRFSVDALIPRLATQILAMPAPPQAEAS